MGWYLDNYWYLLLLLLLLPLGYGLFSYVRWKIRARRRFAEERFQEMLLSPLKPRYTQLFSVMYLLAVLFLILAMVDVLGGKEEVKVQQKMNNVVFLVDLSTSMNAQDVGNDRLSVAKNIVISTMQRMKNDRVGLVVFAGDAQSVMPLTTDYTAAEGFVAGLETSVMLHQGTDFQKGVQVAVEKFKNLAPSSGKIVLISDGEDHEGNEGSAIKEAEKKGVQIISVGVGTAQGAPIPEYVYGQLMGYKMDLMGETVISKRETQALLQLSNSTGGIYIDGNEPEKAVDQIIKALNQNAKGSTTLVQSQTAVHYYQYFLMVAFVLFFIIYLTNPKRDFNI
ncbi:vWA domain-containing protein [Riemerella columbina]|uniref:vWA domain-containing protein n=1 Tax=Riemerella columbina TaxID=103810 RepID=UPI00266F0E3D|nr:VWA domain-containing protein [Riemerella columbina]WKS96073.1 VWA domain-containing protein [Riemerella columbina]